MKLPRLTTRRLMVVVAATALILGLELTRRRRISFRERALSYANAEEYDRFLLDGGMINVRWANGVIAQVHGPITTRERLADGGLVVSESEGSPGYEAATLRRRGEFHASLRRKYERAARYPWLPVEPDPPEPE